MDREMMKRRMRKYGIEVSKAADQLPNTIASVEMARQIIRCSLSVGANYRASQRPRSTADMIAKLKIVEEELDESLHWMETIVEAEYAPKELLKPLHIEGNELLAITVASIKSLRAKQKNQIAEPPATYGREPSVFDG
jgi:four helix bundle protein